MNKFINIHDELPDNGSDVEVLTSIGRIIRARYEDLLGHSIWETDDVEDDEVMGWRYPEKEKGDSNDKGDNFRRHNQESSTRT